MNTIKVNKAKLIVELKKNKEIHEQEYRELKADFEKALIMELTVALEKAKEKKYTETPTLNTIQPRLYVKGYDDAIQMLEFSIDEEVTITQEEFAQYIQNKWNWRATFDSMKLSYGRS